MKHSTGSPTKAEDARMAAIKDGPCVCCHQRGLPSYCPEIHHLLSGNKRRGHLYTIGLCAWHHRQVIHEGWTAATMRAGFGPSLAAGSKPFHAEFGSDAELLALQNSLIEQRKAA
jgi:hypothetical protein